MLKIALTFCLALISVAPVLHARTPVTAQASSVTGRQAIILLTSVPIPKGGPKFLDRGYAKTIAALEEIFRKKFKNTNYDLITKNNAEMIDVYQAVQNPHAIAVIWVSHTGALGW